MCKNKKDYYIIGVDEAGPGVAGPMTMGFVLIHAKDEPLIPKLGIRDCKKLTTNKLKELNDLILTEPMFLDKKILRSEPKQIIKNRVQYEKFRLVKEGIESIITTNKFLHNSTVYFHMDQGLFYNSKDLVWPHLKLLPPYLKYVREAKLNGELKYPAVAAASVLAKYYHDEIMIAHSKNPLYACYGFEKNLGYATPSHREAIKKHGYLDDFHTSQNIKTIC